MKKLLLATVSMVALTSVARAADMPAAMPTKGPMYSPVPVTAWDGAYVGVQGGVVRRDARADFVLEGASLAGDKTGGTAGALLGYNWQHGNFVYGLEGDWSWIGAKFSDNSNLGQSPSAYDVNWLATFRGRVGLAVDSTLFYLTGGAALGHVRERFAFLDFSSGTALTEVSFTKDGTKAGWTIGAGVEHMFAPQWSARAEFRYADLGKTSATCTPGTSTCGDEITFRNSLWMTLVGLNYKFGGGHTADWSQARAHVPAPAASWAGAYLGVQGGVARHDAYFNDRSFFVFENGLDNEKKTGGTIGGLLGYNWQQGTFVYGVEGDWNWIGAKTTQFPAAFDFDGDPVSTSFDVSWLATLRGRAGLALDATLLYVTGGLAVGHVKNSLELVSLATPGAVASFTQNQTKVGWTAGVGAEYMLSPHWTARAEFRYVDLGKTSVACAVSGTTDFNGCIRNSYRGDFSNTLKLGLVGLNYKF